MTSWIFQGNPKHFDVDNYLRDNNEVLWSVRQSHYVNQIQKGDNVYIWRSDAGKSGSGGIIAFTEVISEPKRMKDDSTRYWANPSAANEWLPRVRLKVLSTKLDSDHLTRSELEYHSELRDLLILRMRNNTNYLLTQTQASHINMLWQSSKEMKRDIPTPQPVARSREYDSCTEEERSAVLYEYLLEGNSHRWIDENVLGQNVEYSRGYKAMGVLHHLGLKNEFKGLFKGLDITDAIALLEQERIENEAYGHLYLPIIQTLQNTKVSVTETEKRLSPNEIDEGKEYPEGRVAYLLHRRRERNPSVVRDAKALFIKKHGKLFCEACEFDFQAVYGERGQDFIEGHHRKLVSEMKEGEVTKIEDIAMLCSNCHRMIHRKPLISVEELKALTIF